MDTAKFESICTTLQAYAEHARTETGVPALALAIVANAGGVWKSKALAVGVRRIDQPQSQADANTVFQLASLSKPLSSTVVATAIASADHSKDDWDKPVDNLLYGPAPTITQLLSHRSGLPDHAGDLLEDLHYKREQILDRLRYLPRSPAPYPSAYPFAYTNFGYTAGALAAAARAWPNLAWDELAADLLFRPLGMTHTSYRFDFYSDLGNRAWPHRRDGDGWRPGTEQRNADAQAPAGGACSSANNMVSWLGLCLGQDFDALGGGNAVVRQRIQDMIAYTHQPCVPTPPGGASYGLGWNLALDGKGAVQQASHSGAFLLGAATCVTLHFDEQAGIAILTNGEPIGLPEAVSKAFSMLIADPSITLQQLINGTGMSPPYTGMTLLQAAETMMATELHPPARHEASFAPGGATSPLPSEYLGNYGGNYYGPIRFALDSERRLTMAIGLGQPFVLTPSVNNNLVYAYNSSGENGSEGNIVLFADGAEQGRSVIVENLYVNYEQGNKARYAPEVGPAAPHEVLSIGAAIGMPGRLRTWRCYALQAGRIQLQITRAHVTTLSSNVEYAQPGLNVFFVQDGAITVQKGDLIGFVELERGVVAYSKAEAPPHAPLYSLSVDIVHDGKFSQLQ